MLDAFRQTVSQNLHLNGEYYASLSYVPMLQEKKRIAVYPVQYFMQWGTPEDLSEYNMWSHTFRLLNKPQEKPSGSSGSLIIPMAGLGKRFADEGYTQTKPLIPVSGKPMVIQAAAQLPGAENMVFVLRHDMPGLDEISDIIKKYYSNAQLVIVPGVTEGQACTALIGLQHLEKDGKQNIAPLPESESIVILPPTSSIIFFTIAKPTPLDSNSSRAFSV